MAKKSTVHLTQEKEELLRDLVRIRNRILDVASSIPAERSGDIFLGIWSTKDLLAHLVGWDYTNLDAAKSIRAGRLPKFYAHHDRDWASYNAQLVAQYKKENIGELIHSSRDSHQQLLSYLESLTTEAFFEDTGVRAGRYKVTIDRLMKVEHDDEEKHLAQIESFVQRAI